jgi:hypothetical protein
MSQWLNIDYRDFWDVPRIFFVQRGGKLYLFDCQFDGDLEDYPESYRVFLMPALTPADYEGSWEDLWRRADAFLGEVPVAAVRFDPTRRAAIAPDTFDAIRPTASVPPVQASHEESPRSPVS